MKKGYFLLFIIIFLSLATKAQPRNLALQDTVYIKSILSGYIQYYKNPNKPLTIDQILKQGHGIFKPMKKTGFGLYPGEVWVKLDMVNRSHIQDWLIEIQHPPLDSISLYVLHKDSIVHHAIVGADFLYNQRPLDHRNFIFPVSMVHGKSYTCIIKVQADHSALRIPISIFPEKSTNQAHRTEDLFFGAYFGFLIIILLLAIIVTLTFRKKIYVYYSLYIFFNILFFSSQTGYLYQFIIPNYSSLYSYSSLNAAYGSIIFLTLFSSQIMELRKNYTVGFKIHIAIVIVMCSLVVFQFVNYAIATQLLTFGSITIFPLLVFTGIINWRRGNRMAPYLVVGWTIYLIGGFVYAFRNFGWLSGNFITDYSLLLATVFEVMVFAIAVLFHYNHMTKKVQQGILDETENKRKIESERKKADKLRLEKESKERQLLSVSIETEQKENRIAALKEEISDRQLKNKIDQLLENKGTQRYSWEAFKVIFEQVHPDFFKAIKNHHPQLTINDLRQLAYVKLNLKVKEVAEMTGLSIDAVKKARTRLRKKISTEDSLSDFVQKF